MDGAAIPSRAIRDAFAEYGAWLEKIVGAHKASLAVHRHLPFFTMMATEWRRVPTYAELLQHFSAEGLRRVRLPMRWLHEVRGVEPDADAREENSERRRIAALCNLFPGNSESRKALAQYEAELMGRVAIGRSSLRSVRLAMKPAAALLVTASSKGRTLPSQADLDCYLQAVPGQAAAVTGFFHFLSREHGSDLVAHPNLAKVRASRRRKLERKIMQMARHPEDGDEFEARWVIFGLRYFHAVNVAKNALRSAKVSVEDDGLRVAIAGETYFLPRWSS